MDGDCSLNQSSDLVFDSVQGPSGSSLTLSYAVQPINIPTLSLRCLTTSAFRSPCVVLQPAAIAILADAVWNQRDNVLISSTTVTGTQLPGRTTHEFMAPRSFC